MGTIYSSDSASIPSSPRRGPVQEEEDEGPAIGELLEASGSRREVLRSLHMPELYWREHDPISKGCDSYNGIAHRTAAFAHTQRQNHDAFERPRSIGFYIESRYSKMEQLAARSMQQLHYDYEYANYKRAAVALEEATSRCDALAIRHALDNFARYRDCCSGRELDLQRRAQAQLVDFQQKARERLQHVSKEAGASKGRVRAAIRQAEATGLDGPELEDARERLKILKEFELSAREARCGACPRRERLIEDHLSRAIEAVDVGKLSLILERVDNVEVDLALVSTARSLQRSCLEKDIGSQNTGDADFAELAAVLAGTKPSRQNLQRNPSAMKGKQTWAFHPDAMHTAVRSTLDFYRTLSGKLSRAHPEKLLCKGLSMCSKATADKSILCQQMLSDMRQALYGLYRARCLCNARDGAFASYRVQLVALQNSVRIASVSLIRTSNQISSFCQTSRCFEDLRKRLHEQCVKAETGVGCLLEAWSTKIDILIIAPGLEGLDDIVEVVASFVHAGRQCPFS